MSGTEDAKSDDESSSNRSSRSTGSNTGISELTALMEVMYRVVQDSRAEVTASRAELEIARREARGEAFQVQRLAKHNRALSDQVSLLLSAVETLSRGSSCGDSTMPSVSAALEEVRQLREKNPPPTPKEEVTSIAPDATGDDGEPITVLKEVTPAKQPEDDAVHHLDCKTDVSKTCTEE